MDIIKLYKKHFQSRYYTKKGVLDFAKDYADKVLTNYIKEPDYEI